MKSGGCPWPLVPISELAANEPNSITDGPFGSKLKTAHYTDSGPRVIRLANVGDGVFNDARAHISEEHFATLQKHRVFAGDLVIAALGDNPPRSCIVPDDLGPAIVKADCIRFKPGPRLLPKFANFALNSAFVRQSLKGKIHGVGRPRLNLGEIKQIEIPLPSLAEQQRIVAEIEKQFTRLDTALASLHVIRRRLKEYRRQVLSAACEGRLLFDKWTLSGRPNLPLKTSEPSTDSGERPTALPGGWVGCSLGDLLREPLRNGHSAKAAHGTGGPRVFTLSAVTKGDFSERNTKPTSAPIDKIKHLWAEPGDIYVERSNTPDLVGTARLYQGERNFAFIPDLLIRVRVREDISARYVEIALTTERTRAFYRSRAQGISGTMPKIDQETVRATPIALPPLAEQQEIVREVDRRLTIADALQSSVDASLQRGKVLRQSILHRAFSGQL